MVNNMSLTNSEDSHSPESQDLEMNKKALCISKYIIIMLMISVIILASMLAVKYQESSSEHVSSLDDWICYLGKCFYFSENTATWTASQNFCTSHMATLAVINTTKELDFLQRYSDHSQYWIGLSRKPRQTWQWIDGTIYSDWLKVIGIGECAYLHKFGINSASSHLIKKWICSKPDICATRS